MAKQKIPGDSFLRQELAPGKIRQRREDMGMSLFDLCLRIRDRTGISIHPQTLSNYERGKSYPTKKRLEVLADILNVEESFFYAEESIEKVGK